MTRSYSLYSVKQAVGWEMGKRKRGEMEAEKWQRRELRLRDRGGEKGWSSK